MDGKDKWAMAVRIVDFRDLLIIEEFGPNFAVGSAANQVYAIGSIRVCNDDRRAVIDMFSFVYRIGLPPASYGLPRR